MTESTSRRSRRSRSRSRSRSTSPKNKKKKKKDKKEKKIEKPAEAADKPEMESMSVSKTNQLRVSMGLEPLADPTGSDAQAEAALESAALEKAKDQREKDEAKRARKIKKAQKKLKQKLTDGKSLGDELASKTGGSAADWVKRSRAVAKVAKAKKEAEARAKELAEQDEQALPEYNAKALAGLKVAHSQDQFKEGTVILTLKDTSILNLDSSEMNDDEDTLENVDLVMAEKVTKDNKTKAQTALYDVYDEENNELLPQYADEKEKDTMRLEDDDEERAKKVASIRDKLRRSVPTEGEGMVQDKKTYDLTTLKSFSSDYLPAAPEKFKKRRKKKDRATRKGKAEVSKSDRQAKFAEDEQSVVGHQADHGSREAGSAKVRQEAAAAEKRKNLKDAGYLKALNKAEQQSKKLLRELENVFEDENDEELQSSLDRARRLTLERAKEKEDKKAKKAASKAAKKGGQEEDQDRAEKLAARVKAAGVKLEDDMEDEVEDKRDIVFTATTEFCRGLGAKAEEKVEEQTQKESELVRKELESKSQEGEETEKKKKKKKKKVQDEMKDDNEDRDSDNEDDDDDDDDEEDSDGSQDQDKFLADEPLVSGGMAQALHLAKLRGLLKEEVKQAGRAKDESYRYEDPSPGISIVHLDEFGRPMKPKEAFRKLSHVFHGRAPGPIKAEKKLKQFREEQRRGRILFGGKESILDKLVKKQKKAGEAFVVLDAKARPAPDFNSKSSSSSSAKPKVPVPYVGGSSKIKMELGGTGGKRKRGD